MAEDRLLYAGTYTVRHPYGGRIRRAVMNVLSARRRRSLGVYALRFDTATGGVSRVSLAARTENPSWLTLDPDGRFLYAVNEGEEGTVSAFSVAPDSGAATLLNRVSTRGASPCHVAVDAGCRHAYVANYGSGTVSMHPISGDGSLGESADLVRHYGSSVHERQKEPHPHCVAISPDGGFAVVPDLGTDRIMVYRIDPLSGRLTANDPPFTAVTRGHGPRHLVFHPDGGVAYVTNELASTVSSFAVDTARATLERVETVSALPDRWAGASTAADLHVHPTGRYLYVSNRGHDSIATFALTPSGGMARTAVTRTGGRTPRGFAIDPTGRHLVVAHQTSDDLVSFRIDEDSGALEEVWRGRIPSGVCLVFR
jgi:6-phosphogluconolactonase